MSYEYNKMTRGGEGAATFPHMAIAHHASFFAASVRCVLLHVLSTGREGARRAARGSVHALLSLCEARDVSNIIPYLSGARKGCIVEPRRPESILAHLRACPVRSGRVGVRCHETIERRE